MVRKNGKHHLVGFTDLGSLHNDMECLNGQYNIQCLKRTVLLLTYTVIIIPLVISKNPFSLKLIFISFISGKKDTNVATHVLQFIFLSDCGFRFPVAQFPSANCTPTDLFNLFWGGVLMMKDYGFT